MRTQWTRWLSFTVAMPACLAALTASHAQDATQQKANRHGVEVGDIRRDVQPCDDFFEYANGKWRAENPIPSSMSRWSRRWAAGEASKDRLKDILESVARQNSQKGSIEQLTGDFYAGCMNESQINRLGVEPLKPLLADIDRIKDVGGVQRVIAQLNGIGIAAPFNFYGSSDSHEPTFVIAQLDPAGLGMPDRDYYLKSEPRFKEAREKYVAYVRKAFEITGSPKARAQAAADTVMRIETRFAKQSFDNVTLRDPQATDHKMTFAALVELTPHFDWKSYYTTFNVPTVAVNVSQPKFMGELDAMLSDTSVDDWKIYLKWHALNSAAPSLSDDLARQSYEFNGAFLSGAREMKPRWKRCVENTDNLLSEALGKLYVEKYFPPEAKSRMQDMVANLRLAMKETIEGLDWMSPETKTRALEKLSTFNPKIGYPDRWKDYSSVPVRRSAFWESELAARKFNVADDLATIGKPVDRGRWGISTPTSDAYYNPLLNEIVFPAGILQPPAFGMQASDAVNYGAIGVVIGHEISHGFDDQGAQFDAQGRLANWWTADDLRKFEVRGACVVKQFENYFVEPGLHHNGKLVLGESIGDLAGAKIAYRAFQISQRGTSSKQGGPVPTIDGFTPDQQFFIAWGQFRGDATRPEFARTMVQGDPHPIAKYRVIGPVSNLPEFQRAFSCKAGAPMVRPPAERCEVW
jgi:putative endopeptidase